MSCLMLSIRALVVLLICLVSVFWSTIPSYSFAQTLEIGHVQLGRKTPQPTLTPVPTSASTPTPVPTATATPTPVPTATPSPTPDPNLPAAPSNVVVTTLSCPGPAHVSWQDNALNEDGFAIEGSDISSGPDGPWNPLATLPANATSYDDGSGLYGCWYRVRAFNSYGTSAWSYTDIIQ